MTQGTIKEQLEKLIKELPESIQNDFRIEAYIDSISKVFYEWYGSRYSDMLNPDYILENEKKNISLIFKARKIDNEKLLVRVSYNNKATKTEIQSPPFD